MTPVCPLPNTPQDPLAPLVPWEPKQASPNSNFSHTVARGTHGDPSQVDLLHLYPRWKNGGGSKHLLITTPTTKQCHGGQNLSEDQSSVMGVYLLSEKRAGGADLVRRRGIQW